LALIFLPRSGFRRAAGIL